MSAVLALPILFVSIASLIIQFLQANEKKISIVTYILSIVLVIILLVVTSINNLYYKEEIESLDHMTGSEAEGEKIEFVAKIIYMWLIFGLSVILLVLGLVLIKGCSRKKEKEVEKVGAKEDDIVKAYDMSGEDAINLVKEIYNSDNYEFSVEINKDSKYIVSVKNTLTESTTKFLVDPTSANGSFYEIDE